MTGKQKILDAYAAEAQDLALRFDALAAKDVLEPVIGFLPSAPCDVADIGAGSGRDAAWLAARGYRVTAVEPVAGFVHFGKTHHTDAIEWVDDRLPELAHLRADNRKFDVLLVGSVWHHLNAEESARSLVALARLLRPGGRLILSLKVFGDPGTDSQDADTLCGQARQAGLEPVHIARAAARQDSNRLAGNMWDWLVLEPGRNRSTG